MTAVTNRLTKSPNKASTVTNRLTTSPSKASTVTNRLTTSPSRASTTLNRRISKSPDKGSRMLARRSSVESPDPPYIRSLMKVAAAHHRGHLLYKYGLNPWRLYVIQQFERTEKSIRHSMIKVDFGEEHYNSRLKLNGFLSLLEFFVTEGDRVQRMREWLKKTKRCRIFNAWKSMMRPKNRRSRQRKQREDPYAGIIKFFRLAMLAPKVFRVLKSN